eukprot:PhF_6_TR10386/c0_g1_i2/m.16203
MITTRRHDPYRTFPPPYRSERADATALEYVPPPVVYVNPTTYHQHGYSHHYYDEEYTATSGGWWVHDNYNPSLFSSVMSSCSCCSCSCHWFQQDPATLLLEEPPHPTTPPRALDQDEQTQTLTTTTYASVVLTIAPTPLLPTTSTATAPTTKVKSHPWFHLSMKQQQPDRTKHDDFERNKRAKFRTLSAPARRNVLLLPSCDHQDPPVPTSQEILKDIEVRESKLKKQKKKISVQGNQNQNKGGASCWNVIGRNAKQQQQQPCKAHVSTDAYEYEKSSSTNGTQDQSSDENTNNDDVVISCEVLKPIQPKKKCGGNKKGKQPTSKDFDQLLKQIRCVTMESKTVDSSNVGNTKQGKQHLVNTNKAEMRAISKDYQNIIEKAEQSHKQPAVKLILLREAFPLAEQLGDVEVIHNHLMEMGELYNELGEFRQAQECAERVMLSSPPPTSSVNTTNLLRSNAIMGRSFESLVQPEKAKPFLETALKIAEALDDKPRYAGVLGHMGIVHELMGDYDTAFQLYSRTLAMAQDLNDRRILCETTANLGLAHLSIGNLDVARRLLKDNVSVARLLRDAVYLSRALTNVAHVHMLRGELNEAIEFHEQELRTNQDDPDAQSQGVAQAYGNLGNVYKLFGKYEDALRYYTKELEIVRALKNEIRVLESLSNCGIVARLKRDFTLAMEYHREELVLAQATGDVVVQAKAILNQADVDCAQGQNNKILYHTAFERYHRTLYLVTEAVPKEDRALYMVKVGCCEAEWRALDGLETAFLMTKKYDDAVWRADAKHLPLVTSYLRKQLSLPNTLLCDSTAAPQPTTADDPPPIPISKTLTPATIQEFLKRKFLPYDLNVIMEELHTDVVVVYSMYWEDGHDINAYVRFVGCDEWYVVTLTFSSKSSKVLVAQKGTLRTLLAGKELDMPLLPHAIYSKGEHVAANEPCTETLEESLAYLYNDMFKPIDEFIMKKKTTKGAEGKPITISIVTDGLLTNIPFCALREDKPDGKLMVEKYEIHTVPGLEILCLLHERRKRRREDDIAHQHTYIGVEEGGEGKGDEKSSFTHHTAQSPEDLTKHVLSSHHSVLWLNLPTACEMREDYTGTFVIGGGPTNRLSSEDLSTQWKGMSAGTIVCDGFSCFTYRVVHESCVSLTRALLGVGGDRILGMLWYQGDGGCCSSKVLRQFIDYSMSRQQRSNSYLTTTTMLREFQIQCMRRGEGVIEWAFLTVVGLP